MTTSSLVFVDANAIIYALDETSKQHENTVALIQRLLDEGTTLCTSHHVIEEVLHIVRKISKYSAFSVVEAIDNIPNLVLVEPDALIDFAKRYSILSDKLNMGINDALLTQIMLDAGIGLLLSYDKQLVSRSASLGIKQVL